MSEREGVKAVGEAASGAASGTGLAPASDGEERVAAGQQTPAHPASQLEEFHRDCTSCGERLIGDFCHRCGEKRPESRDLTLRHFFTEAAHELTSVEHSKLFHTVWAVLFRPGFLTNEWIAGRRRLYLKPLNLCLGIFALSLFAYSVYKPVSMYDLGNLLSQNASREAMVPLEKLAAKRHVETEVLLDRISEKWQRYMSLSPLIFVAAFALVLQLVFMFTRRYFVEHLVFSMHYVSFSLLTVVMFWPVYFFIGIRPGAVNTAVAILKWAIDIVYMFFAVRAVFRLGTGKTILASLLLIVGYFLSYMLVLLGSVILATIAVAVS